MKNTKTKLSFVLLLVLFLGAVSAQKSINYKKGFVKLFNGKDWTGWDLKLRSGDPEMAKNVYAIENGMVHVYKNYPDSFELNKGTNQTHGLFFH